MSLDLTTVDKIAHLARLALADAERDKYRQELNKILAAIEEINAIDTSHVQPMAHSMDELTQRLRADEISETNQRDRFQAIAPATEAGLYLVPKVIE
jgi:aspartyl-tRNA(Asn)/glutamyl-tRNA(Gln) amidotransferase subunit C